MNIDANTYCTIQRYLKLTQKQAGELLTTAAWLRKVISHPEYKYDAIITQRINYDLLRKHSIVSNDMLDPELYRQCVSSKTMDTTPATVAEAEKFSTATMTLTMTMWKYLSLS